MFGLSTHCSVSHGMDADFPMNLKTQPRVYWTNLIEENARLQDASKPARVLRATGRTRHIAQSADPKIAPVAQSTSQETKIFESITNSSGGQIRLS
jgi:hypothetical protein